MNLAKEFGGAWSTACISYSLYSVARPNRLIAGRYIHLSYSECVDCATVAKNNVEIGSGQRRRLQTAQKTEYTVTSNDVS